MPCWDQELEKEKLVNEQHEYFDRSLQRVTVIAESYGLASDDRKVLYGHSSTLIFCEEKKAGNNGKHCESGAPHPRRSDCQLFDSYYYSWVRVSATAELTKSTLNSCAM